MLTKCTATDSLTPAEWTAVLALRYAVLREPWGEPRGSERVPLDDSPTVIHVALFQDGACVGCALAERDTGVWTLHMVAVDPAVQGKGVGRTVTAALEAAIRNTHTTNKVEFYGRVGAVPFYERMGYAVVGPGPTYFGSVHYKKMAKLL